MLAVLGTLDLTALEVAREQSQTWRIGVPVPVADRVAPSALVMTLAGGEPWKLLFCLIVFTFVAVSCIGFLVG